MTSHPSTSRFYTTLNADTLKKAYELMCVTQEMNLWYETHADQILYPFSTSRGHEAIQIAAAMHLKPCDYFFPYYRDEAMLLAMGIKPYELMLQLLAKKDDPFSGGRMPYLYTVLQRDEIPVAPLPGSVNGSHVIPATGLAQGLMYLLSQNLRMDFDRPVVLCSLGDAVISRGEISEAMHIAILKKLPVIYLVQDNDWSASVQSDEIRAVDAYELAGGFRGMKRVRINGADFVDAYDKLQIAIDYARLERMPVLLHAKCPLLGNHNEILKREQYRTQENIVLHQRDEPLERLRRYLLIEGETEETILQLAHGAAEAVAHDFHLAMQAVEPDQGNIMLHKFAPARTIDELDTLRNENHAPTLTLQQAVTQALDEILNENPEVIYYGEEVGSVLGGVHGEAAGLISKYGSDRIVNMPPTDAYLIGAAAGLVAAGCRPVISLTSAQQLLSAMNQLNRLSQCYYLSNGQTSVPALIRVPVEDTGVETLLLQLKGLKIVYPATAADMKGLLKAAFADPNPVVVLENTALYTAPEATSPEPDADYIIPLGKARIAQSAADENRDEGTSLVVITYGMGVHWAKRASEDHAGSVEILDLRTLQPLDWDAIIEAVKRHGKVLVLTAEPQRTSFAESLAGRITQQCFRFLDAPVFTCGSASVPALPINQHLAAAATPNARKVSDLIRQLLEY